MGAPKPNKLVENNFQENIPKVWLDRKSPQDWARIASNVQQLPRTEDKLYARFVEICQKSPLYGMCLFWARRHDSAQDYVIGVDYRGVHIINNNNKENATELCSPKISFSLSSCWLATYISPSLLNMT